MKNFCVISVSIAALTGSAFAQEVLFQDDFRGKLGEGWSWVREHREAWRVTERGLEVRVEPGNIWGPQNNAKNLLVRPAPDVGQAQIEASVVVEDKPTHPYEQVDLVWYYDDSNMVKLGQELVDGKVSVVMGREENDNTHTVAIIPVDSTSVRLRILVKANRIHGQFRVSSAKDWQDVGECSIPAPPEAKAKVSLQFYQGAENVEHWARVTEFRIVRRP
jgi:regulation of enolase protein 1 (concanavalin A-like superfamily)